ncbi:MAG: lysostaphin resistance A-like protein [Oscillospiraceae bacterium]
MMGLYKKDEVTFSIVCIVTYVILMSIADNVSRSIGFEKIITMPFSIIFASLIFVFLKKNDLLSKHGLNAVMGGCKKYLFFLPLVLITSVNVWNGVMLNYSVGETVLYIISMLFIGFIEEMLFRGFLFTALRRTNVKMAIIISSLTFGIGHIVNLLNGAPIFETLLQMCYATAIGFLFTIIYYRAGSIIPCIITHSVLNALSATAVEASQTFDITIAIIVTVVSVVYAIWILKAIPANNEEPPQYSITA